MGTLRPIKWQDSSKIPAMCFQQVQRFILAKKYFGVRGTLKGTSLQISPVNKIKRTNGKFGRVRALFIFNNGLSTCFSLTVPLFVLLLSFSRGKGCAGLLYISTAPFEREEN